MTTAPTDADLAAVLERATLAVFRDLRRAGGTDPGRPILVVEGEELASFRRVMRLAPGPAARCMCAGDLELSLSDPTERTIMVLHHGTTMRWLGPSGWSDVAFAYPDALAAWLAQRGVTMYLDQRAEHDARERQAARDDDGRARVGAIVRARWLAAAPDLVRDHAARATRSSTAPDERTTATILATLRASRGDTDAILDLLRWFGFDHRGRGDGSLWTTTRALLAAAGDQAVLDVLRRAGPTLDDGGLRGATRYLLHVAPARSRTRKVAGLPEALRHRLREHARAHPTGESADLERLLDRTPGTPADHRVPRTHVHLRMIADPEYVVMVGGGIDEVWQILDGPPRPHEHLILGERSWSLLRQLLQPVERRCPPVAGLWGARQELMAGSQGYIVRQAVVADVLQALDRLEPAGLGLHHEVAAASRERMLTPADRRPRALVGRDLDDALTTFACTRDFLRATAHAGHSLHVGGAPPLYDTLVLAPAPPPRLGPTPLQETSRVDTLFPRPILLARDQLDPARHLSRPIGGPRDDDEPGRPWVAIAVGRRDGAFVLAERGPTARALLEQADANLARCPHTWSVSATRGVLFWKKPSLLRAYGDLGVPAREMATDGAGIDDLSSDLVLRPDVMDEAATLLRAPSLFVAIPKRGWLLVGAGEPGDLARMLPMHQIIDGLVDRAGRHAISRRLFFYRGGTLFGWSTLSGGSGSLTVTIQDDADRWNLGPAPAPAASGSAS